MDPGMTSASQAARNRVSGDRRPDTAQLRLGLARPRARPQSSTTRTRTRTSDRPRTAVGHGRREQGAPRGYARVKGGGQLGSHRADKTERKHAEVDAGAGPHSHRTRPATAAARHRPFGRVSSMGHGGDRGRGSAGFRSSTELDVPSAWQYSGLGNAAGHGRVTAATTSRALLG